MFLRLLAHAFIYGCLGLGFSLGLILVWQLIQITCGYRPSSLWYRQLIQHPALKYTFLVRPTGWTNNIYTNNWQFWYCQPISLAEFNYRCFWSEWQDLSASRELRRLLAIVNYDPDLRYHKLVYRPPIWSNLLGLFDYYWYWDFGHWLEMAYCLFLARSYLILDKILFNPI